ncbi:prepilin-type N-terminal cleavage/methylation domain-containing protein [Candidatus Gracilibacteria bacterium]|nr:prepilin-type N-terminal cleavage/methylation domain-containing protein [Candidatus Gracilibacteria bacterium]
MIAKQNLRNKTGFTILELMISMTLFAMIITSVILAVQSLMIARTKTLNRVALLEELYFFSEQLFTGIKDGGTLDYEEYWNRKSIGVATQSGHYQNPTGLGNYGQGGSLGSYTYGASLYLCRSNSGTTMGTGGCLTNNNNGASSYLVGSPLNFSGASQRYGEYLAQFTDYNGNIDNDLGDEDGDASGSIIGDDDDRLTGDVPDVFTGAVQELYLINKGAKTRTYFRWNIVQDPNNLAISCFPIPTTASGKLLTGSGCVGNIQVLKTKGLDFGFTHSGGTIDRSAYDGVIDTWACIEKTQCSGATLLDTSILATGGDAEWVNLFPATINIKYLSLQVYPTKDPWLSWSAQDAIQGSNQISPFIHPYVRLNLEMGFSAGKRRILRNEDPTISISTSVSLSDFD